MILPFVFFAVLHLQDGHRLWAADLFHRDHPAQAVQLGVLHPALRPSLHQSSRCRHWAGVQRTDDGRGGQPQEPPSPPKEGEAGGAGTEERRIRTSTAGRQRTIAIRVIHIADRN